MAGIQAQLAAEHLGYSEVESDDDLMGRMVADRLIAAEGEKFNITNLGAILFARRLSNFEGLARKAPRAIFYKGVDRVEAEFEQVGVRGYVAGISGITEFINKKLPVSEELRAAFRIETTVYPPVAIRELVANALIHQDFNAGGTSSLIEVFSDRIEVSNPGLPLIPVERFLDMAPQARNDRLAAIMHRIGLCEERGAGIDRVISLAEFFQLPPPLFSVSGSHTKASLFAPRKFEDMDRAERIRACYQHAGLCEVSGRELTNESLRKRFGLKKGASSTVSKIIGEAVAAGLIKRFDPSSSSRKYVRYVPIWSPRSP